MAAQVLTEHLIDHKQLSDYIKLLIEMAEEVILGKEIRIEGLEYFLKQLSETGLIYDSKKRKVVTLKEDLSKRPDWGVLKNGRNYDVTVGSMDIVGSSELVKKFGRKTMEKFYSFFWATLGVNAWEHMTDGSGPGPVMEGFWPLPLRIIENVQHVLLMKCRELCLW